MAADNKKAKAAEYADNLKTHLERACDVMNEAQGEHGFTLSFQIEMRDGKYVVGKLGCTETISLL